MSKEKKADETSKVIEMKTDTTNSMVITVEGAEGRIYKFYIPFYAPLPECYNAGVNVANEIARLYNEAVEKAKEKAKEEEIVEEIVEEEES